MVIDDIEIDSKSVFMEGGNKLSQSQDTIVRIIGILAVASFRSEEEHRIISPVVTAFGVIVIDGLEIKHRKKLNMAQS